MTARANAPVPVIVPATVGLAAVVALVARARLAATLNGHWDEYNFLRFVYEAARGELSTRLQTFHVHLFGWLTHVRGTELDRILAARHAVFALQLAGAAALVWLGRRLLSTTAGLYAVLLTSSFSFVLRHGTEFRYDGILSPLFLVASALIIEAATGASGRAGSRVRLLLAGALTGLSLLVSVKAAFFLPTLGLLAVLHPAADEPPRLDLARQSPLRSLLVFAAGLVVVAGALYAFHAASLAPAPVDREAWVDRMATTMIVPRGHFFPRWRATIPSFRFDVAAWSLLAIGFVVVVARAVMERGVERRRALSVLALALPIFTVLVYRNAWPYFWVTILPGASLLAGAVVDVVTRRLEGRRVALALAVAALVAPLLWNLERFVASNGDDENEAQRSVLAAVHEVFPTPVRYVDRCGMVSSFPKVGPFMSTLSVARYRKAKVFQELLDETPPVFVLANIRALDLSRSAHMKNRYHLDPDDFLALRARYVHHWGPLWVAGAHVDAGAVGPVEIALPITGAYTVEAQAPVTVDGAPHTPGDVVTLAAGAHTLEATGGAVTLRFGDHLRVPAAAPSRAPLFRSGFSR